MNGLFDYPESTAVGRVVPKRRIYEATGASTALKAHFIGEVDKITWAYKLAPGTMNLPASKSVIEIQIFNILLKTEKLNESVLTAIDKAIPSPLIFELMHGDKSKVIAAYKRPALADEKKMVISEYFSTDWVNADATRTPLPVALNLKALYAGLLSAIMPQQLDSTDSLQRHVERMEAIRAKTSEVERMTARVTREKQFNKRVAMHAELKAAKKELEQLLASSTQQTPKSTSENIKHG